MLLHQLADNLSKELPLTLFVLWLLYGTAFLRGVWRKKPFYWFGGYFFDKERSILSKFLIPIIQLSATIVILMILGWE